MTSEVSGQQGAAFWPPLLSVKRIRKLTDAAQELFGTLYDLERAHKAVVKARLAEALAELDLFGLSANRTDSRAREYEPDERGWS